MKETTKAKREFRPKFTIELLGINPFIKDLVIPVATMPVRGQYKKDKDGDLLPAMIDVESERMCKVYVTAEKRKKVNALPGSSKELLLWIYYEIESGDDFLWINRPRYMEENNINSMTTYRTALAGLIDSDFIRRTNVNAVYWINPALFFSGSRAHKFPKNVKKK